MSSLCNEQNEQAEVIASEPSEANNCDCNISFHFGLFGQETGANLVMLVMKSFLSTFVCRIYVVTSFNFIE